MVSLAVLLYHTLLGLSLAFLFLESRYSRRRTCLFVYGVALVLMISDVFLYRAVGEERFLRLYTFTNHLPALLALSFISRTRGWQLVFQLLSGVFFCTLVQHLSALLCYFSGGQLWVLILSYAVFSTLMVLFLLRCLRPLYLQVLNHLHGGWWLMCVGIALYYVLVIYLIPEYVGETAHATILKPTISLLLMLFYALIVTLFSSIHREMENRHNAEMFAVQLAALQRQMESSRAAEEALRIERHDLRHRLNTIASLARAGERQTLLSYIGAAQEALEETAPERWCADPVLNAVFSFYFTQARRMGIRVEASLAFPDPLPVEAAALSTVFANALENAIHACQALPEAERQIVCHCISRPKLMLEVSNPCAGPVVFDADGFPAAGGGNDGHGQGLRSIRSFCEKNGALPSCGLKNGWFYLRVAF